MPIDLVSFWIKIDLEGIWCLKPWVCSFLGHFWSKLLESCINLGIFPYIHLSLQNIFVASDVFNWLTSFKNICVLNWKGCFVSIWWKIIPKTWVSKSSLELFYIFLTKVIKVPMKLEHIFPEAHVFKDSKISCRTS